MQQAGRQAGRQALTEEERECGQKRLEEHELHGENLIEEGHTSRREEGRNNVRNENIMWQCDLLTETETEADLTLVQNGGRDAFGVAFVIGAGAGRASSSTSTSSTDRTSTRSKMRRNSAMGGCRCTDRSGRSPRPT